MQYARLLYTFKWPRALAIYGICHPLATNCPASAINLAHKNVISLPSLPPKRVAAAHYFQLRLYISIYINIWILFTVAATKYATIGGTVVVVVELTCTEYLAAAVATGRELRIVAVATIDLIGLRSKLLVDQIQIAFEAEETGLVPVLVFVR